MTVGDERGPRPGSLAHQETVVGHSDGRTTPSMDTMSAELAISHPRLVDPSHRALDDLGFENRYEARTVLGRGGMGEVQLCADSRIGRDIAMKVVRGGYGSRSDMKERFLYEARVQGQLEHPAIVPVYDLGLAPDGTAFFTMKRVRGRTLQTIVQLLANGDEEATKRYTLHKLLTAMMSVCLAVDFAHARGTVHRDIKPSNVMLGDFGEVYLLDWGLAKVVGASDTTVHNVVDVPSGSSPQTAYGVLMGTPGYMPSEQIDAPSNVGPAADIYALGCVLFELLALEPLHKGGTAEELITATVLGGDARLSVRAPGRDLPPELELVCVRATALDPASRYESARALCDALERFLEGDQDLARRRVLAQAHTETVTRALSSESVPEAVRRQCMRELGRALALDPNNPTALRTMVRLLMEVPKEVPLEVKEELEALSRDQVRLGGRSGAIAFLGLNLYLPLLLWMGIRSYALFVFFGFATLAGLTSFAVSRLRKPSSRHAMVVLGLFTLATVAIAGVLGPFILLPGMAASGTMIFTTTNDRRLRGWIIVAGCAALLIPVGLELVGVLPPSITFDAAGVHLLARVAYLPRMPTLAFLLVTSLATIITSGLALLPFRDQFDEAQLRMRVLSWHLRHLVPDEALIDGEQAERGHSPGRGHGSARISGKDDEAGENHGT